MNQPIRQGRNALAMGVWVLWIDSVGGFQLLEGDQFSVGGLGGDDPADIAIRSAWRSRMAVLSRSGEDFWLKQLISGEAESETSLAMTTSGEVLAIDKPTSGAAANEPRLRLEKPSPLSRTVVVTLDPPHRFVTPVDAFLLTDKMILIGQDRSNHIRVSRLSEGLIMIKRGDDWTIRKKDSAAQAMFDGQRIEIAGLAMTIRRELRTDESGEKR